jgi:hypothetical protein
MVQEMATKREAKPKFPGPGSGRNPRGNSAKASSATAKEEKSNPSTTQLMEEWSNEVVSLLIQPRCVLKTT